MIAVAQNDAVVDAAVFIFSVVAVGMVLLAIAIGVGKFFAWLSEHRDDAPGIYEDEWDSPK